jgi:S-formylglutathione hydrolase
MSTLSLESSNRSFNGWQQRYSHRSDSLGCQMMFSVYLPPNYNESKPSPIVYWLSGLTCDDQNFVTKAGAQRMAAKLGLIIVTPDTSPRGDDVPDDPDKAYDFGLGAGFYLNATHEPWNKHYRMYDYVSSELPQLIKANFNVTEKAGISGHSMGGHGALVVGLTNTQQYSSISALAPIVNPINCPWGQKAFSHYLGNDKGTWEQYDSCALLEQQGRYLQLPMLVDQGEKDEFLDSQHLTKPLEAIANDINYPAQFRYHADYDHGFFFVASFIEDHFLFHAKHLGVE